MAGYGVVVNSEESLVEAAQKGNLQSFAALYERYYAGMVALAYSVLADTQLSEDAAQETFAIACRDLPRLRSKEKFASWLAGICRNVARQIQRARKQPVALNEQVSGESDDVTKADRGETVRRAVRTLRVGEREPIVLRYYDNMPYEQIGAILGISVQAVHGRLTRAKRKIAKHLKCEGFTGGDYEQR